jgi:hypothetical protein
MELQLHAARQNNDSAVAGRMAKFIKTQFVTLSDETKLSPSCSGGPSRTLRCRHHPLSAQGSAVQQSSTNIGLLMIVPDAAPFGIIVHDNI